MILPDKSLNNVSGIYCIKNCVNYKFYIGQTKCLYKRCKQYVFDYNRNRVEHINTDLYEDMIKYGIDKFIFYPVEFCKTDYLIEREYYYITFYDSINPIIGYNRRRDTQNGMITHPATSEKIRRNITKQWNDGIRDKHGEKLKANWATTPERNSIQAKVMTKALTKYEYLVTDDVGVTIILNYQELTERGLKSCMSTFHRKKTNEIVFKGNRILRRKING